MPCVGLQRLALFLWWIRQSRNVPLVFQTLWLQHVGDVRHHILIMCEGFLNACLNGSCAKAGDGVIHLVWMMKIIFKPKWQVKYSCHWSKQFRPIQSIVPCIEIICSWLRPHSFCKELEITSVSCNFQLQSRFVRPFPRRATYSPQMIISNLHECPDYVIHPLSYIGMSFLTWLL